MILIIGLENFFNVDVKVVDRLFRRDSQQLLPQGRPINIRIAKLFLSLGNQAEFCEANGVLLGVVKLGFLEDRRDGEHEAGVLVGGVEFLGELLPIKTGIPNGKQQLGAARGDAGEFL